ncbi:site-specific integrase [Kineosporia sp. NBRC 101731]|uniref:site-specific integrase n=1 Tax=Kineosporia sp. NBRC 101731 TaxID=3032199 RepID=UPI0024A51F25|nr:site-specific integrase [Kineosporia sp. NBRC 101731]GLY26830.1 site-specific integrase [Kineosporia sp. NBRC 101731]
MTTRRGQGDGSIFWEESRKRWVALADLGYGPNGKRIRRKAIGRTKTEVREKLKEIIREHEDGAPATPQNYTVADAVDYWLAHGLSGRSAKTVKLYTDLARDRLIPGLGKKKLRDLSVEDVEQWLKSESKTLSTRSLKMLHSVLNRSVKKAQARDKVRRNIVLLCEVPEGERPGRPSKSLTLDQASKLLDASEAFRMHAYIVLSILTGARPEELRALRWREVDLIGGEKDGQMIPASIAVLRSVRESGDTKTQKSRRRLAMPIRCVKALQGQREKLKKEFGAKAIEHDSLVFPSAAGTEYDLHNLRHAFRRVVKAAGLNETEWTLREMRHTFVSLLSDDGVSLEDIARLVGHQGTAVTELVYRHQLRPILEGGATAMDRIFGDTETGPGEPTGELDQGHSAT